MKLAICQVADTGPLESLVVMLRQAGYVCHLPDSNLRQLIKSFQGAYVEDPAALVRHWGYPEAMPLPLARPEMMAGADLYVDVKAHRIHDQVVAHWPNLKGRVLWYRINGSKPEHVVRYQTCTVCGGTGRIVAEDCGDEVDPPCPVLTPNQWYRHCLVCDGHGLLDEETGIGADEGHQCERCRGGGLNPRSYTCWPPFVRFDHYGPRSSGAGWSRPICLVHRAKGWGYERLFDRFRSELGVQVFGMDSPDGLLNHNMARTRLRDALAYVHLKSSDAPGYALYEALASGCPVVCTRRLIWRCRMQDLLIPGSTCLTFDRETHDGLTDADVVSCTEEVASHLTALKVPEYNRAIGDAGRQRLQRVMWSVGVDGMGFADWMNRMFNQEVKS